MGKILEQAGAAPAEKAKESPNLRTQLLKWKTEEEAGLERLNRYSDSGQLPEGIDSIDISTRRRIFDQALLAITRHLLILDVIQGSKDTLKELEAAAAAWKGFDTPPPYSVLMVDELLEKKEAVEGKQASNRSSAHVYTTTLDGLLKESKAVEEEIAALSKPDANDAASQWKLETAKAKQRAYFIRASSLKYSLSSLEYLIASGSVEISLLNRKIKEAGDNLSFTSEDMDRIKSASADRQAALRKELANVRKRLGKIHDEKVSAAAALTKARENPEPDPGSIELAELNVETAVLEADSLQALSDFLDSFVLIEAFVPEAYESRFELLTPKSPENRKHALETLTAMYAQLDALDVVAKNELAAVAADVGKQQSRLSLVSADDPKLPLLSRQRTVLWEKQAIVQRAHQSIVNQRRTLSRWIADYRAKEEAPWYMPVTEAFSKGWDALNRLWNISVNSYEETIEIDGQKVAQMRFVSLGDIITAVVLFVIAYLIAAMISRRVQRILIHRRLIGEAQARTLRNWLMLLVAFLLAFATLSWLSIPITIFAFLAGALAIGVGFGTQTIIKNFISGIILLFERKVRVGDIIEVDGINGVVSEINTRSSIVRGFNGIENLIPNSLFLENRVVNWTLNSRLLRRELTVGVVYGSPAQSVIDFLNDAAARHGLILKDPAPFAVMSNFGATLVEFTLYFWIELNDKTNSLVVASDLRIMIEKGLTELGVSLHPPLLEAEEARRRTADTPTSSAKLSLP